MAVIEGFMEKTASKIDWSLYAILDKGYSDNRSLESLAQAAIRGGAGLLQLRNKSSCSDEFYEDAVAIRKVTRDHGIPFIVNDRLDIALAVDADGVHLGQEDLPHAVARRLLGENKLLGVSVHSEHEFEESLPAKPDYFGVGTIFASSTKSELPTKGIEIIKQIRQRTQKPLVAIGGIALDNLAPVLQAGADGVAVISALWSVDDIEGRARAFLQRINRLKMMSTDVG